MSKTIRRIVRTNNPKPKENIKLNRHEVKSELNLLLRK